MGKNIKITRSKEQSLKLSLIGMLLQRSEEGNYSHISWQSSWDVYVIILESTQSAAHPIITFRVLKNHPQSAGNGISKTLNVKIVRGGVHSNLRPGGVPLNLPRGFSLLRRSNIVKNSRLTADRYSQIISGYGTVALPLLKCSFPVA